MQNLRNIKESHCETQNSSAICFGHDFLRLWQHLSSAKYGRRYACRNLLQLPSLFHGQAKADRLRRTRRKIHEEIPKKRRKSRGDASLIPIFVFEEIGSRLKRNALCKRPVFPLKSLKERAGKRCVPFS